jgi:hypothetical protein
VPGLNPAIVLGAGATSLRDAVDAQYLPAVISAYKNALVSAFTFLSPWRAFPSLAPWQ